MRRFAILIALLLPLMALGTLSHYVRWTVLEASRAPIFPLAGTAPEDLRDALADLASSTNALSRAQSASDRALTRNLYPIMFLEALADAEAARIALIAEPTFRHAWDYEHLLDSALEAGALSAEAFASAMRRSLGDDMSSFYSFAGKTTTASLVDAAEDSAQRMSDARHTNADRWWCRRLPGCTVPERRSIALTGPAPTTRGPYDAAESFFVAVRSTTTTPVLQRITLSESACARELAQPHVFLVVDEPAGRDRIHYLSSVLFAPTTGARGDIMSTLKAGGLRYVVQRPLSFYACAGSQHDLGMIASVRSALSLAARYPNVAEPERAAFFDAPSDVSAKAYAEAAIRSAPSDIAPAFAELSLALDARSASLDELVREIARVLDARVSLSSQGIPFRLDAENVYATHSAFPSLFLLHDTSILPTLTLPTTHDAAAFASSSSSFIQLNDVHISQMETLISDTRTLYRFDRAASPLGQE